MANRIKKKIDKPIETEIDPLITSFYHYIECLAARMDLGNWTFFYTVFDRANREIDTISIEPDVDVKRAAIKINPKFLAWRGELQRQEITRELLRCHFAPVASAGGFSEPMPKYWFNACFGHSLDAVAKLIAPSLPLSTDDFSLATTPIRVPTMYISSKNTCLQEDQESCSFCGKYKGRVANLIAGPGVYICDECIALSNEIIEEVAAEKQQIATE